MYSITYRHKGETIDRPIYMPSTLAESGDYSVISASLTIGCGKAGELVFEIPSTHPEKDNIIYMSDEIFVRRDENILFIGRAVSKEFGVNGVAKITCEGILTYLLDSYANANRLSYWGANVSDFLHTLLLYHFSMIQDNTSQSVGGEKYFESGIVSTSLNQSLTKFDMEETDKVISTLDYFTENIINEQGGYLRVRVENGHRYVDYIDSYGAEASQSVEINQNVLDFAYDVEYGQVANRVCLAQKLGDQWTIHRVDADNIDGQQIIAEWLEWADKDGNLPVNWYTDAKNYVNTRKYPIKSIKVNAIDLHLADETIQAFKLGDVVNVNLGEYGAEDMTLTSITYDLLNPSNDKIELGIEGVTMTSGQTDVLYNFIALNNRVNKLEASEQPTPVQTGEELIMSYQSSTSSAKTFTDSSFDWTKFREFRVIFRFMSGSNYYFQTQTISKGMIDGTYGATSQGGNYNFNCYMANSNVTANIVFDFANRKITHRYNALVGFTNPYFAVIGIY